MRRAAADQHDSDPLPEVASEHSQHRDEHQHHEVEHGPQPVDGSARPEVRRRRGEQLNASPPARFPGRRHHQRSVSDGTSCRGDATRRSHCGASSQTSARLPSTRPATAGRTSVVHPPPTIPSWSTTRGAGLKSTAGHVPRLGQSPIRSHPHLASPRRQRPVRRDRRDAPAWWPDRIHTRAPRCVYVLRSGWSRLFRRRVVVVEAAGGGGGLLPVPGGVGAGGLLLGARRGSRGRGSVRRPAALGLGRGGVRRGPAGGAGRSGAGDRVDPERRHAADACPAGAGVRSDVLGAEVGVGGLRVG